MDMELITMTPESQRSTDRPADLPETSASNTTPRPGDLKAWRQGPILPLGDIQLLGRAGDQLIIRSQVPVVPGDRLSLQISAYTPPMAAIVQKATADGKGFQLHVRCVAGVFDR